MFAIIVSKMWGPASPDTKYRGVGDGWAGWAIAHPGFGRSVNTISTRGDRLCLP